MKRHGIARSFAVVVLGLTLAAIPLSAEAGPRKGGNSPSAKVCQKGGWQERAPSEDPTNAFDSEEACTSYAAEGGTIVAVQQASIIITFRPIASGFCYVDGNFSGLTPNAEYTVTTYSYNENFNGQDGSHTFNADGDGTYGFTPFGAYASDSNYRRFVRFVIDGVADSGVTEVLC